MDKVNKEFFVLAHNIRSLLNVGSIFRTCDSLGVSKLFLSGYTATPISNHKLAKTAIGAEKFVPWEYNKSAKRLIGSLRKKYPALRIVGLENNLNSKHLKKLSEFKPKFPLLLILGEEVNGIPKPVRDLCDEFVEIPMKGQKESLNVAVALGVAVYAITQK
jgi:tRNA G18 (ribose-2'-O)-methylase SpoU